MTAFRYQALKSGGSTVSGVIEADDRKAALRLLGDQGLFPSSLENCAGSGAVQASARNGSSRDPAAVSPRATTPARGSGSWWPFGGFGGGVRRKQVTAFTREIASLLAAGISIPQALASLGEEEESEALRAILVDVSGAVRRGVPLSDALDAHPRVFDRLYTSILRVGEEAGALPRVMNDLASFLEHEDEVRSEVVAAVSYPIFVLGFGVLTVIILLGFVMPRMFTMLQEMLDVLPLPTLILLNISSFLKSHWFWIVLLGGAAGYGVRHWVKTPKGRRLWDRLKLQLPFVGPLYRSTALGRFCRTLGTLVHSGVSLLPALKIVEATVGNRVLADLTVQVAEETRGGQSLAGPLRQLRMFPSSAIQMINVGEETGKLDEMLLKVAEVEERHMRARTKTLISLLAPALILVVGALVGFMVIALLLPIFKMSQAIQ